MSAPESSASVTETTPNGQLVFLWMSRQDICRHLDIPPHILFRLVQEGDVAADLSGDRPRYRLARPLETTRRDRAQEAAAEASFPPLERPRPQTGDGDYLDALVGLIDQLTERLVASERRGARLERERDAAIGMARQLARQTDGLTRQLHAYCRSLVESNCALADSNEVGRRLREHLQRVVHEVQSLAGSPLALPIRGRLQGLLEATPEPACAT